MSLWLEEELVYSLLCQWKINLLLICTYNIQFASFQALLQKRLALRRPQESNSPITQIIFWHFKGKEMILCGIRFLYIFILLLKSGILYGSVLTKELKTTQCLSLSVIFHEWNMPMARIMLIIGLFCIQTFAQNLHDQRDTFWNRMSISDSLK